MSKVRRLSHNQMRILKIVSMFLDMRVRTKLLKKLHVFAEFGEGGVYASRNLPEEPYMVKLHKNVYITPGTMLLTHDSIPEMLANMKNVKPGTLFPEYHLGTIEVFDNVFIGTGSMILNGVKIGPNAIVAAGSVVTKDVPEGTIVGGNPAKVIGTVDNFIEKRKKMMDRPIDRDPLSKIMKYYWGEKH